MTMARLTETLIRVARRVKSVLAECNYAQRRMTTIMTSVDRYLDDRDQAPGDYTEFLFRTSGVLMREPDAGHRARGQLVS
jgi:hypothetical protein